MAWFMAMSRGLDRYPVPPCSDDDGCPRTGAEVGELLGVSAGDEADDGHAGDRMRQDAAFTTDACAEPSGRVVTTTRESVLASTEFSGSIDQS
jgi:hypothetical protein